ncbi:protein of unknown function [Methylocaldum szegediense]|uniref:Uncharacterized protein n=1 Tax=Methylocaldum szegediense TaxID=73780 RepID=A0ABN8X445_9GAMM|nr:protein of unknown function [Methylocaldum szegediense]
MPGFQNRILDESQSDLFNVRDLESGLGYDRYVIVF